MVPCEVNVTASLRMVATNIRPPTVDWFMMKIKVEVIVIVTLL